MINFGLQIMQKFKMLFRFKIYGEKVQRHDNRWKLKVGLKNWKILAFFNKLNKNG